MENTEITNTPATSLGFVQAAPEQSSLATIESDRAIAEIKGMLTVAKMFPRDEAKAVSRIQIACQRPILAEVARYTYNRGGNDITGPSIRLIEEVARCWGNIVWGWKELERNKDCSTCVAYAWDLENVVRREAHFQVPHYRDTRGGRKRLQDDRDIYELCANMASRRMRACLENIIPGDVIEIAERECDATLRNQEDVTREGITKMLESLATFGITRAQVEKRIGRSMESITPAQMVGLRRIYMGLRDGMGKPEDYFIVETANTTTKAGEKKSGTEAIKDKLSATPVPQAKEAKSEPPAPVDVDPALQIPVPLDAEGVASDWEAWAGKFYSALESAQTANDLHAIKVANQTQLTGLRLFDKVTHGAVLTKLDKRLAEMRSGPVAMPEIIK